MTGRRTRSDIEDRLLDVRRALRDRRAGIEPDAHFANRVIARLPRNEGWSFDWAARRVLPVSLAVALALTIAVLVTAGSANRTIVSASVSSSSQTGSDPLEWLLEGRQEVR
jgi:hypothetical protein